MRNCLPLIILAICSSCATIAPGETTVTHLPVRSFVPELSLTALLNGRLRVRDGCLRLIGADGGSGMLVIWPKDTELILEGRHQIVIVGGSDQRLKVGSKVQLGGGGSDGFPPDGLTAPLPARCGGPYFHSN
jgi:hypothetical protein